MSDAPRLDEFLANGGRRKSKSEEWFNAHPDARDQVDAVITANGANLQAIRRWLRTYHGFAMSGGVLWHRQQRLLGKE